MPVTYCIAKGEDIVRRDSEHATAVRNIDCMRHGQLSPQAHLQSEEVEGG